jgi:hypothetical protein
MYFVYIMYFVCKRGRGVCVSQLVSMYFVYIVYFVYCWVGGVCLL